MNICVLGSTSYGNCTAVWNETDSILIDCGLKFRQTEANLHSLGLSLEKLTAVLVTHCHADHVSDIMVKKLCAAGIPLLCHLSVRIPLVKRSHVCRDAAESGLLRTFGDTWFSMSSFAVQSFPVSHDAPGGCFGFKIYEKRNGLMRKFTIATDLGCVPDEVYSHFINSDVIVIESNHDRDMLENSDRAYWLKKRIREAHLSNDECTVFLQRIMNSSEKPPSVIVLAHISDDCNSHSLVLSACNAAGIEQNGTDIILAQKNDMTPVICI